MIDLTIALIAFGALNLLAQVRGTRWVRGIAVATTIVALLWPAARIFIVLAAWLVWTPPFMVAWALDREACEIRCSCPRSCCSFCRASSCRTRGLRRPA